ncbi:TPA_asm: N [Rose alphacytorhabdovirus 1]|nr:TPA_asm: N [Rose alphacytorhabdovirus 1]
MASALRAALEAENKYADIDNLTLSLGKKAEKWAPGDERKIKIYNVTQLKDDVCVSYGTYMIQCLSSGSDIDSDLLNLMLCLAVSMRDPDDVNNYLLSKPERSGKTSMSFIPKTLMISDQADSDGKEEQDLINRLNKIGKGEESRESDEVEKSADRNATGFENDDEVSEDLTVAERAAVYAYMAGYLMRLQCRQTENVHSNLSAAKERFKGWYARGADLIDSSGITRQSLESLKGVISRRPEIVGTWVMWLAHTENEVKLNRQPRGLLEYIGLQIYAYQGLHVVTQILTIKQLSKYRLGALLRQLDCPLTREGVMEVYNLIKNHEVTEANPERKTYFRYARVWSDGYFLRIRSKDCAPLLYTAARVVKEITPNLKSDPTKIYALQNLGAALRETLDAAALRLVKTLMDTSTLDAGSGDMWQTDITP